MLTGSDIVEADWCDLRRDFPVADASVALSAAFAAAGRFPPPDWRVTGVQGALTEAWIPVPLLLCDVPPRGGSSSLLSPLSLALLCGSGGAGCDSVWTGADQVWESHDGAFHSGWRGVEVCVEAAAVV